MISNQQPPKLSFNFCLAFIVHDFGLEKKDLQYTSLNSQKGECDTFSPLEYTTIALSNPLIIIIIIIIIIIASTSSD